MPHLNGAHSWAIILCDFSDSSATTRPLSYFEHLFTHNIREDNLVRYWSDVSHGHINLSGTTIYDWEKLPLTIADAGGMSKRDLIQFAATHFSRVQQIDFRSYYGIIMVTSEHLGLHGHHEATLNLNAETRNYPWVFCHQDHSLSAIAHEMGHAFYLDHSFNTQTVGMNDGDGRPGAYGDPYDIMSYGNVQAGGHTLFGETGPIVNAVNMHSLGWLDSSRVADLTSHSGAIQIQLRPLSRRDLPGFLAVQLDQYLIEFRVARGWDSGLPLPGFILVHSMAASYKDPAIPTHSVVHQNAKNVLELRVGDRFDVKGHRDYPMLGFINFSVESIDMTNYTATINVVSQPADDILRKFEPEHPSLSIMRWLIEGEIGIDAYGKPVRVPPRPITRDILVGLAVTEMAAQVQDPMEQTRIHRAGMELIARSATDQLVLRDAPIHSP